MTIEKETPRTKERRSVAEKRLEYLEKRTPTPPNVPRPADIIQIPRHSPDSLIEVNSEVYKKLLSVRLEPRIITTICSPSLYLLQVVDFKVPSK